MKLYHLGFSYGYYEDSREYHLGTYSSEEKRELAIQQYRKSYVQNGTPSFIGYENNKEDGQFEKRESELDENIYQLQLE